MGKKYQEIKAQKLRNSRKNQTKQQEPRRLSRAGEEHFAFLADRQEEIQNPPPVDSFVNIKGDSGEGKCGDERDEHPDNQEEGQHDPDPQDDGNSSCSSDCGGNLGMISPIGGRQSLYTVPS